MFFFCFSSLKIEKNSIFSKNLRISKNTILGLYGVPPRDAPRGGQIRPTLVDLKLSFFHFFQKTYEFQKTRGTDYTGCRQETLQEAAVCQIPIRFLKILLTSRDVHFVNADLARIRRPAKFAVFAKFPNHFLIFMFLATRNQTM